MAAITSVGPVPRRRSSKFRSGALAALALTLTLALGFGVDATLSPTALAAAPCAAATEAELAACLADAATDGGVTVVTITDGINLTSGQTVTGAKTITITSDDPANHQLTKAVAAAGFTISGGATVTFADIVYNGNSGSGPLVRVAAGGTLTLDDGTVFQNNHSTSNGGAISTAGGGSGPMAITLNPGAVIRGNTVGGGSGVLGGALYVGGQDSASIVTLTIAGTAENPVVFENNATTTGSASDGGAIYLAGSSHVTIDHATFTGNYALGKGGAIEERGATGSTFSLTNSTFENNSAGHNEVAANNTNGGAVHFDSTSADLGGPGGVLNLSGNTFIRNTADPADGLTRSANGGALYLTTLALDVNLSGSTFIRNEAIGSVGATAYGGGLYVGKVSAAAQLVLDNVTFDGNTARNTASSSNNPLGGGLYVASTTAPVSIINSTFTGNVAGASGGGIYLASSAGGVTIADSVITGNTATAKNGGGVYIGSGAGPVTVTGADIGGNSAGLDGGGVYADEVASMVIGGDTAIYGNSAYRNGGGVGAVPAPGGTLNITDQATITTNSATAGGGLWLGAPLDIPLPEARIDGQGSVSGNNASGNGGGVYTEIPLTVAGHSQIGGNTAGGSGGGVYSVVALTDDDYAGTGSALTVTDDAVIGGDPTVSQGNCAPEAGGGIYMAAGSELALSGGALVWGNVGGDGGGVYLEAEATATMADQVHIESNTASLDGGGLYLGVGAQLTVTGGTVELNTAARGAGLFLNGAKASVVATAGQNTPHVTGNIASESGGGVYAATADGVASALELSGGESSGGLFVNDNTAETDGAGIYLEAGGSLTADEGVEIRNNFALTGDGGGVWMGAGASADLSGSGRKILDNKAFHNGGGIWMGPGATVSLRGGGVEGVEMYFQGNQAGADMDEDGIPDGDGDGGGIWVAHDDLANLDVAADVWFMGNTASRLTTEIAPVDQPTYDAHVFTTLWSDEAAPATLGYNNYDIAYLAPYFSVTFDEQGGSEVDDQTVLGGDTAAEPDPESELTGYTLDGWYEVVTDPATSDPVVSDTPYDFATPVTHDTALQAKWEAATYTVTFAAGGGTGSMADQVATYGQNLTLTANAFEREGYTFAGWDADGDSRVDYADQADFEPWERTSDLALTAVWRANSDTPYTVEHYYVDAAGDPADEPFQTDTPTGLTDRVVQATPVYPGSPLLANHTLDLDFPLTVGEGIVTGDGSLVLKLYYPINWYDVTFDEEGGSVVADQSVAAGDTASPPDPDSARTGYTLAGWYEVVTDPSTSDPVVSDTPYDFSTPVTHDVALQAKWDINTYLVTFTDGLGVTLKTEWVEYGADATAPDDPSRAGYTFDGWDGDYTFVTDNVTVNATWTPNSYTVRYLPGVGGGGSMPTETAVYGENYVVKASGFTRAGYTFAGWDAGDDGVSDYAPGFAFVPWDLTSDLTLTALWHANGDTPYSVEHYLVRASGTTLYQTVEETGATDSTVTAEPITVPGYALAPNHAGTVATGVVAADGSLVLKLYYEIAAYTVTFTDGLGTELSVQTVEWGEDAVAPAAPTREGYTFDGWDSDYTFVTSDLTVNAQWLPNSYAIHYLPGVGGVGSMADQSVTFGEDTTLNANGFSKPGYVFAGWDADGDGLADYGDAADLGPWSRTDDLTLTALWNADGDTRYAVEHVTVRGGV
ncbi:MAG: InlB B-repeat-containing protein, partial [Propionibacteriaceae bacterium]|nr:InlB B-repeat-containing protein [Propionibacteriaceae bacterium]